MSNDFKAIVFDILNDFIKKERSIQWSTLLGQEELMEFLDQAINRTIHNFALLPDIQDAQKEALIGKLAVCHARMAERYGAESEQDFVRLGADFEEILRTMAKTSNWISVAQTRYADYEKFEEQEEAAEEELELSEKELNFLRPVFLAIDIFGIITIQDAQDEECEDECEESEEYELCEDECDEDIE